MEEKKAVERAVQVTITDEHLDKMTRLQDGAFEIGRLMDGFDLIYRTVRDKFSCEGEYSDEEDGLHVIFEQLISRTREFAERMEREALEVWGGFHTILEAAEKAGKTTTEAGV
ncbi:MAG: hypothetical protein M0R18_02385 [Deltaproteobacteria bacterium]|nr:hypothetical protein [Deltaproteobacteria bacterium]MDX9763082.1 hypothetical protein [Desulfomonilia bacterium]